jgi:hypothetical protein
MLKEKIRETIEKSRVTVSLGRRCQAKPSSEKG